MTSEELLLRHEDQRRNIFAKSKEERISSGRGKRICKDPAAGKSLVVVGAQTKLLCLERNDQPGELHIVNRREQAGSRSPGSLGQSTVFRLEVSKL